MYFPKPVLAILVVIFLAAVIGFIVEAEHASNVNSQKSAANAKIMVLEKNANKEGNSVELTEIKTKLGEIVKAQTELKKQQQTTKTSAGSELQKQLAKQDATAQTDARTALKSAQQVYTQAHNYNKFTPTSAALIEPALQWTDKTSTGPSVVAITRANGTVIQLCTLSDSGSFFCIAENTATKTVTYGVGASQSSALKALASDGWSTTNTQGEELPYTSGG